MPPSAPVRGYRKELYHVVDHWCPKAMMHLVGISRVKIKHKEMPSVKFVLRFTCWLLKLSLVPEAVAEVTFHDVDLTGVRAAPLQSLLSLTEFCPCSSPVRG